MVLSCIAATARTPTVRTNMAIMASSRVKPRSHANITEAFSEKLLMKRENVEGYLRADSNNVKVSNKNLKNGLVKTDIEISRGYLTLEDKNGKGYYKSASVVRDDEGYLRTVYNEYNSNNITKFGAYLLSTLRLHLSGSDEWHSTAQLKE